MSGIFSKKPHNVVFVKAFLSAILLVVVASCVQTEKTPERVVQEPENIVIDTAGIKQEKEEVKSNKRNIYLTFDDGPNKGTENLLKVINRRKVPVTAFVVGKHVYGSKSQMEDFESLLNDTLIELANHSYSHAGNKYSKFYKDSEVVLLDFNQCRDSLNFKNNYTRLPGRNIWRTADISVTDIKSSDSAANHLFKSGYKIIGWDLEWKPDGKMALKGTHQEMMKKIDSVFFNDLEKTSRNLIFLTHDQYLRDDDSVKELELFIKKLQDSGRFEFKKLSAYPGIGKNQESVVYN